MFKAWLIILVLNPNVAAGDDPFLGKVELPFVTMADCRQAEKKSIHEGEDIVYRTFCVTDDHHAGRKYDPGVPLFY